MAETGRIISCEVCTAKYVRTEVLLPIKDVGICECAYCGSELERWHGRLVPTFRLHAPPLPRHSSAA